MLEVKIGRILSVFTAYSQRIQSVFKAFSERIQYGEGTEMNGRKRYTVRVNYMASNPGGE